MKELREKIVEGILRELGIWDEYQQIKEANYIEPETLIDPRIETVIGNMNAEQKKLYTLLRRYGPQLISLQKSSNTKDPERICAFIKESGACHLCKIMQTLHKLIMLSVVENMEVEEEIRGFVGGRKGFKVVLAKSPAIARKPKPLVSIPPKVPVKSDVDYALADSKVSLKTVTLTIVGLNGKAVDIELGAIHN